MCVLLSVTFKKAFETLLIIPFLCEIGSTFWHDKSTQKSNTSLNILQDLDSLISLLIILVVVADKSILLDHMKNWDLFWFFAIYSNLFFLLSSFSWDNYSEKWLLLGRSWRKDKFKNGKGMYSKLTSLCILSFISTCWQSMLLGRVESRIWSLWIP